jgi:hypothetical protein
VLHYKFRRCSSQSIYHFSGDVGLVTLCRVYPSNRNDVSGGNVRRSVVIHHPRRRGVAFRALLPQARLLTRRFLSPSRVSCGSLDRVTGTLKCATSDRVVRFPGVPSLVIKNVALTLRSGTRFGITTLNATPLRWRFSVIVQVLFRRLGCKAVFQSNNHAMPRCGA